jgi:cytochrome c oxidase subunit 1/cytochrome c oxidase subunit I+III
MTRRVYTYQHGLGWGIYNLLETVGGYVLAGGLLMIAFNIAWSSRRGAAAGRDPFHGGTLEWATTSPPPHYNFAVVPTVRSAYPNWDEEDRENDLRRLEDDELVLARSHETPLSTVNDAALDRIAEMPPESPWPIVVALATSLAFALVLTTHYVAAAAFVGAAALAVAAWNLQEPEEA